MFEKRSAWAKDAHEKDADSYNLTNFGLGFKNLIDKKDCQKKDYQGIGVQYRMV